MADKVAANRDSVDAITEALLTVSRLLVGISARSIEDVDEHLTIPQFRALVTLSQKGSINLATFAELLEVKPSAAGRMVDRLVAAGLIDRRPHPTSRRELLVVLSPQGRKVLRQVITRRRKVIADIVENMPTSDRRGLARGLTAFAVAGGESSLVFEDEL